MTDARDPVWLIVVAAGKGERLGSDEPKAFRDLCGRPLFAYGLESAARSAAVTRILLVADPERAWPAAAQLSEACRRLLHGVCLGGAERHDSVREGLRVVRAAVTAMRSPAKQDAARDPVVLVHDAARPFAPPDLFLRVAEAAARGPAVCVRPVADTVKEVAGGWVRRSIARESLALAQTPQGARLSLLEKAHDQGPGEGVTDDAMLLESLGVAVQAVAGADLNFKITTPDDFRMAEAWVKAGGAPWMPPSAACRSED
jgi:2-C-methyl-D-erythritol 4-phosphate cytidylyltransferase